MRTKYSQRMRWWLTVCIGGLSLGLLGVGCGAGPVQENTGEVEEALAECSCSAPCLSGTNTCCRSGGFPEKVGICVPVIEDMCSASEVFPPGCSDPE
jgi:hypothetical protein